MKSKGKNVIKGRPEQIEKVIECVKKEGKMKRSRRECGEEDGVRPGGTQSLGLHFLQVEESGRQPFEGVVGNGGRGLDGL